MRVLLAELNARPDTAETVAALLHSLADHTRSEPGNLIYGVHRAPETPEQFLVYELYRDPAACEAHLAAEPVQRVLQRFESLLAAPPTVRFFDALTVVGLPAPGSGLTR